MSTELEALRQHLNSKNARGEPSWTYLPLVIVALVRTLNSFPQCNVLYDAARGVLVRHRAVHVGVATQTPDGLKVPVVRHAERLTLAALAAEIRRVTERARANKASREELVGSTITVTSLGKWGESPPRPSSTLRKSPSSASTRRWSGRWFIKAPWRYAES